MNDQFPAAVADGPESTDPTSSDAVRAVEPTGHAAVDAVLTEVEGLEDRPLEDHVGVFERAHDQLRRVLDVPEQS